MKVETIALAPLLGDRVIFRTFSDESGVAEGTKGCTSASHAIAVDGDTASHARRKRVISPFGPS
jgi:hypothetical protein